jgi:hypothetical protein
MLKKLETQGVLTLPAKRTTNKGGKERIIISHQTDKPSEIAGDLTDIKPIELTPVINREEIRLWNEYVERYHILGYKRPFGAHQRYFIISRSASEPKLGCILFAASSWALAARDEWIGWSENDRSKRLNLIINNTRFLIFPWVQIKNLASHALSLAAKRVRHDWQTRFCYQPVLLETFLFTWGGRFI